MIVRKLNLHNYRNYSSKQFEFKPGINVILGENAVGKTNIVEAIYYLSLPRSFRGVDDIDLIKYGEDFASISSKVEIGKINRDINIVIFKQGRRITINNKPIERISDLAKTINVILFEPKDVLLFKGSPKDRRNFLDISLTKQTESYLSAITRYNKVLKERNEVLKQDKVDKTLLETTTEMLIKTAAPIVKYREGYLKDINDILNKITLALTGTHEKIEIIYHPFVANDENYETNARNAFNKALETDLKHKATSVGIHREDFSINLFDKDIATFGSQGQNRLVALALKLSPYFLIEDKDKKPIVVLDDVMSELDEKHQQVLIKFLKKFEQIFITTTKLVIAGASHYEIKK